MARPGQGRHRQAIESWREADDLLLLEWWILCITIYKVLACIVKMSISCERVKGERWNCLNLKVNEHRGWGTARWYGWVKLWLLLPFMNDKADFLTLLISLVVVSCQQSWAFCWSTGWICRSKRTFVLLKMPKKFSKITKIIACFS